MFLWTWTLVEMCKSSSPSPPPPVSTLSASLPACTSVYRYPPELPTSWLLPVLRDHISHSRLAFFRDHLLPIATTLRKTGTILVHFDLKRVDRNWPVPHSSMCSCDVPPQVRGTRGQGRKWLPNSTQHSTIRYYSLLRITSLWAWHRCGLCCPGSAEVPRTSQIHSRVWPEFSALLSLPSPSYGSP